MKIIASGFEPLAEEIAELEDGDLCYDIKMVDSDDTVLFVCSPDNLDGDELYRINRQLIEGGNHQQCGIITGRTIEEARELYHREGRKGDDSILLRGFNDDITIEEPNTKTTFKNGVSTDQLTDLFSSPLQSFSALVNARNLHAYLDDGYICGFPEKTTDISFDGKQPPCVVDGERDCPRSGTLVPADELSASHVFLSTCDPIIPDHDGMPVNFGLGLLSNACSLITYYRVGRVKHADVALHYSLLRAGYPSGERVYLLNRNAAATKCEKYPYALFGRPSTGLSSVPKQEYDLRTKCTNDGTLLKLRNINADVLDLRVSFDELANNGEEYYLRQLGEPIDDQLFYTTFEEDDTVRCLIYTWRCLEIDSLEFRLVPHSVRDESPATFRAFSNADDLKSTGLIPGKAKGQTRNARNHIKGVSKYLDRESYDPNVYRNVRERFEDAKDGLKNAAQTIAIDLRDRDPSQLGDIYRDNVSTVDVEAGTESCPYCGRGLSFHVSETVFKDSRRMAGECSRCAYVFDCPLESNSDLNYPILEGDFSPVTADSDELSVSFYNPDDSQMTAAYVVGTAHHDIDPSDVFNSRLETSTVPPKETSTVVFDFNSTALERRSHNGMYSITAFVVTDRLNVYQGIRTVRIPEEW